MEQSIINKYIAKKQDTNMYSEFEKLLDILLNKYDLTTFESIVSTFERDGSIQINDLSVSLNNECITLLGKFVKLFEEVNYIDYSNNEDIYNFVTKIKSIGKKKEEIPEETSDDTYRHTKYFNDIDSFNNYLYNFITH